MRGKIAISSYQSATGRTTIACGLFNVIHNSDLSARLFGYDMEKQDLFTSGLLGSAIAEPVFSMVPSLDSTRCNFCGNCLRFCSRFAIQFDRLKPKISLLPDRCHSCGDCMKGCSHDGIIQHREQIGSLYHSPDGRVCAGEATTGARFILPLFIELNKQKKNDELIICDIPPGDSGFVSTSLMNVSLAMLVVVPSSEWEKQTIYMLDYLKSMKMDCVVLVNRAEKGSDFFKVVAEFCFSNHIPLIGEIPLFESKESVCPKLDIQAIEIFNKIWAEIESFFYCKGN